MAAKDWLLSRRTFLHGTGVSLALPLLQAMVPPLRAGQAIAGQSIAAPRRMGILYFPNGVWNDSWIPKETGSEFELPFSLEPLAPIREQVLVLSGLDKKNSHEGDGHYAKTANFLTGMHVEKTTGKSISSGGTSLDQLVAQSIGQQTPMPSLELGIDPVAAGIDSNVGYTRLYASYISWESANRPIAKEIHPRRVFERLFGVRHAPAPSNANDLDRRSLLDLTLEEAAQVRKKLGRDDQYKMDEYLDSVRAVEKQIDFWSQPAARERQTAESSGFNQEPPVGIPRDYAEHVRLMFDLMALAFETDSTRVISFMFANDVSSRNFSFVEGVRGAHHELSHHENKKEKIEQYRLINRWHVEEYVKFLQKLQSLKEGEGSVLDNSMIMLGCGFSDGNKHQPNNLPILLGGKGGGTIESGRHLANPDGTPLCNLYLSMLNRMGVAADQFGDSSAPLALS